MNGEAQHVSLVAKFASKFGVEPNKMIGTLKATAFRQNGRDEEVTNEQMMALLVVADQYNLNPWTREIFAFNDRSRGVVPIVSVDGWSRIINEHSALDGVEFTYGPASGKHKDAPEWIECSIYRKDRSRPTVIREFLAECYRDTGPWNSHPSRMLRWKSLIQASRVAFGFSGIYDQDEAERIIERDITPEVVVETKTRSGPANLKNALAATAGGEPPPTQAINQQEKTPATPSALAQPSSGRSPRNAPAAEATKGGETNRSAVGATSHTNGPDTKTPAPQQSQGSAEPSALDELLSILAHKDLMADDIDFAQDMRRQLTDPLDIQRADAAIAEASERIKRGTPE